ncbi:lysophospholipid acyltransferase family protein [Sphingomonas sp. SUN039]|uniref:lysophospholipid acyltransferase family protein n=1 Tax=Sphingomonas sp. SUN039 TaxID=2937787 RepID=UPI0021647072|nr:lysophospholipid acyltransferase family protein [Sphingomonas sp. SUN039]UVO55031.1 lysophospholipid acyltransferase family protein [Sphingomonas sp. SUN039]
MSRVEAVDEAPGLAARLLRRLLVMLYRRGGWTSVGTVPEPQRFVLIAVPHTSNWDFPNFLGVTHALGIRTHFIAKSSLFRWPMGGFMRQVGGVRLDRATAKDTVQQMVDEFARRDDFVLTIAPEGTRGAVGKWRSGFYQIALGAGVPIVCGFMDYPTRTSGLGPVIVPTGDYEADMAPAFAFYRNITGKHPARNIAV